MAQNAAIRNIADVLDVAPLPYHVVEPILRRIDNPAQLRHVETGNPQIAEHTAPLWKELIKRDVSNADRKMVPPKDPKNWWRVYEKMVKQEVDDKLAAEESLKQAMNGLKSAKGSKETTFVPRVFEPSQIKTVGFYDGIRHTSENRLPSLRNAKNGRVALNVMQRATASKANVFKTGARGYMPSAKSQIKVAPKSMIQDNEAVKRAAAEAKKYAEPVSKRTTVFAPMRAANRAEQAIRQHEMNAQLERESRLRSLTASAAKPAMHPSPAPDPASISPPRKESHFNKEYTAMVRPVPAPSARRSPPVNRIIRPAAASQRPQSSAPVKRPVPESNLSPSPPSSGINKSSQGSQPQRSAPTKRKRPVADPFLTIKRPRT
jgi:elongin-A